MSNDINKRIYEIRCREGLSLEEFGSKVGYAKSSLNMIERGERAVTEKLINAIVTDFCVNENWLKFGEGTMYDEEKKKKHDSYMKIRDEIIKTLEECNQMECQLYPHANESNKAENEDFMLFDLLTSQKEEDASIESIKLVSGLLNFYLKVHWMLSISMRKLEFLNSLDYGDKLEINDLEKKLLICQKRFEFSISQAKDYIKKHSTNDEVLNAMNNLDSILRPIK